MDLCLLIIAGFAPEDKGGYPAVSKIILRKALYTLLVLC